MVGLRTYYFRNPKDMLADLSKIDDPAERLRAETEILKTKEISLIGKTLAFILFSLTISLCFIMTLIASQLGK